MKTILQDLIGLGLVGETHIDAKSLRRGFLLSNDLRGDRDCLILVRKILWSCG